MPLEIEKIAGIDLSSGRGEYFIPDQKLFEFSQIELDNAWETLMVYAREHNMYINTSYLPWERGVMVRWKQGKE